ncbi:hypothetical protein BGL87_06655 [Helicobacter pylori]|uniref:hypothetical protein n=1 Tax=Helicobacter pylori TaxID=210 RepID=UPI0009A3553A|nr:hypothetical protein [Helicobacter pylori]OPG62068.1 hypothetical protein BGL87_06655 [Helicobacter pylori]
METQKKQLRDNILKSLIVAHINENDELKGHEVIEYKIQDNNGNLMVNAILKRIGSINDLKTIALDLKMLKSLLINVVIDGLWSPLPKN